MEDYITILKCNETWLMGRILDYAKHFEFTRYTSTLKEAWRLSIQGLTESLILTAQRFTENIPELHPDETYLEDPASKFGVIEAKKHRERGVTLSMFLGLFKYYKQTYIDLIDQQKSMTIRRKKFTKTFTERCFDRIEIAYCTQWNSLSEKKRMEELQVTNRNITNEKNVYLTVFESLSDPVIFINNKGRIVNLNSAAAKISNPKYISGSVYYNAENQTSIYADLKKSIYQQELIIVFPWLKKLYEKMDAKAPNTVIECTFQKENETKWFEAKYSPMMDVSDKLSGIIIVLREITQRKIIEERLEWNNKNFENAQRMAHLGSWEVDLINNDTFWSDEFFRICEYKKEEISPSLDEIFRIIHPDDRKDFQEKLNQCTKSKNEFVLEHRLITNKGRTKYILTRGELDFRKAKKIRIFGSSLDITTRKKDEQSIKKYAETQNVLLREVNHRVKNNLSALIGMLQIQENKAKYNNQNINTPFFTELNSRIRGLLAVHTLLSAGKWQPVYLSELIQHIIDAALYFVPEPKKIDYHVFKSIVKVNSQTAHNLTLVINELTTNCIKHSLRNSLHGFIKVKISHKDHLVKIHFSDDGPGFSRDVLDNERPTYSIGFELIKGIVELSMGGKLSYYNKNGANIDIEFENEIANN